MRKEMTKKSAVFVVALVLPAAAFSAPVQPVEDKAADPLNIKWSLATGMGYDSNAYQAPSAAYTDYFPAVPVSVNPQEKSGLFVPYEAKVEAEKRRNQDNRLTGSVAVDGSFYIGSGLSNANEYNINLNGGTEHVFSSKDKSEDTLYVGALAGKHKQVYVDHDTGLGKTNTAGTVDVTGRYSFVSTGVEVEYKHRTGKIDYGFNGQYVLNNYERPTVGSEEDHSYLTVGADASISIADKTRLNLSADHVVRDYSSRHTRDAQGTLSVANPLLVYTSDAVGASLRNRISDQWLIYVDFDHTQRADNHVGYGDYSQNRYGARIIYAQDRLKTRLAAHHWSRDYPNGFAFDNPASGAKTYSGNDLKFRAEWAQTKNAALWSELVYDAQTSTDLRYDYVRTIAMAGMIWAY